MSYFIWEYPTTVLIQKLPLGKYVGVNITAWGTVVVDTSSCSTYGRHLTATYLTGALEATISLAFLHITFLWYTRDDILSRMGFWYAGNSFGGVVASVLSYATGHIDCPFKPWRWLYIVRYHQNKGPHFRPSLDLWRLYLTMGRGHLPLPTRFYWHC